VLSKERAQSRNGFRLYKNALLHQIIENTVYLRGFIPGAEIGQLQIGQSAEVYLDNDLKHQSPLQATIAAIDSKASFTPENVYFQKDRVEQVFGVKLNLGQPGGFTKPGMLADAEIVDPRKITGY
jgi:HlyD family secretion protein